MKSPVINMNPRGCDDFGCGEFGAPRHHLRNGIMVEYKHQGFDIKTQPNEPIFSPINGKITKLGYPYGDDLRYRYIRVVNNEYKCEMYYTVLDKHHKVGDSVSIFDQIGIAQNVAKRYEKPKEKMINHTHFKVYAKIKHEWVLVNPEPLIKKDENIV